MPATTTLLTTTLNRAVGATDDRLSVASVTNILVGRRLWIDQELMEVLSISDPWVTVRRGLDGTTSKGHSNGQTVTIGRAQEFYWQDPVGRPEPAVLVSPWINVTNGTVWYAQGDVQAPGSVRWWQKQTATYTTGALGRRIETLDPTSST